MNKRVSYVVKAYSNKPSVEKKASMDKRAITDFLNSVINTGASATALVIGLSAAAGAGIGWAAEKITAPSDTDFDNARDSYTVGNLRANIISNMNKLTNERMTVTNKKQKSIRMS